MPKPDLNKARGLVCGLALGEALAAGEHLPEISESLPTGLWGDGTSMALALAESLLECDGVDQRDQMIRYTSWFRYGYLSSTETCDNIDPDVREAIMRFERTWNPQDTEATQGTACLVRLAPVALYYAQHPEQALEAAEATSRTTHAGQQSIAACRSLTAATLAALDGASRDSVCAAAFSAPSEDNPEAVIALRAAVEAFAASASFAQGCAACLPHGKRAMAVYGQLAGAWYGLDGLPAPWLDSLVKRDQLEATTQRLLEG